MPPADRHDPGLERDGVMDDDYARGREERRSLRYRLARRASEVVRRIRTHAGDGRPRGLLDLGTADGRMMELFEEAFPAARVVGVELGTELVRRAHLRGGAVLRADVTRLPFADGSFDAVVACAVIEHLRLPLRLIEEARRVLAPGGLVLLTAPNPFWEHVATMVGHLPDEQHHFSLDIEGLARMVRGTGFELLEADRFMLSPVGMPRERDVERFLKTARLESLLANQIVAGRRP